MLQCLREEQFLSSSLTFCFHCSRLSHSSLHCVTSRPVTSSPLLLPPPPPPLLLLLLLLLSSNQSIDESCHRGRNTSSVKVEVTATTTTTGLLLLLLHYRVLLHRRDVTACDVITLSTANHCKSACSALEPGVARYRRVRAIDYWNRIRYKQAFKNLAQH